MFHMNIPALSQRDKKWSETLLGTSKTATIGGFGCTITCLAMISGLTPDEVNARLRRVGGFSQDTLIIWSKINEAIPWVKFVERVRTYDNDKVSQVISINGFCLVEVDFDGKIESPNDHHWVLYLGDQRMNDPWTGFSNATSKYPLTTGYAVLTIDKEPESAPEEVNVPSVTFQELVSKATKYDEFTKAGFQSAGDVQRVLGECQRERDQARDEARANDEKCIKYQNNHTTFLERLATIFQCKAEEVEIESQAKEAIKTEDENILLKKQLEDVRNEDLKKISKLEQEVTSLREENNRQKMALEQVTDKLKEAKESIIPATEPKKDPLVTTENFLSDLYRKVALFLSDIFYPKR